jgi:hypothetical protein
MTGLEAKAKGRGRSPGHGLASDSATKHDAASSPASILPGLHPPLKNGVQEYPECNGYHRQWGLVHNRSSIKLLLAPQPHLEFTEGLRAAQATA